MKTMVFLPMKSWSVFVNSESIQSVAGGVKMTIENSCYQRRKKWLSSKANQNTLAFNQFYLLLFQCWVSVLIRNCLEIVEIFRWIYQEGVSFLEAVILNLILGHWDFNLVPRLYLSFRIMRYTYFSHLLIMWYWPCYPMPGFCFLICKMRTTKSSVSKGSSENIN